MCVIIMWRKNYYSLARSVTHSLIHMSSFLHLHNTHSSRLGSAVVLNKNMDGLVVYVPDPPPSDIPWKLYKHNAEGRDDMPAHIKSALTNNQLTLSLKNKKLILGTWQGLYLFEHRLENQTRILSHHLIGD